MPAPPPLPELPAEHARALRALGSAFSGVYLLTEDLRDVSIRRGDVLVHAGSPEQFPSLMFGRVRYLGEGDYEVLRSIALEPPRGGHDALRPSSRYVETFVPLCAHDRQLRGGTCEWMRSRPTDMQWLEESLYRFLTDRRQWGRRLRVWHSRLAVVRPPWESVSEPVRAASDDGAIFELLTSVGCRMPLRG